ncbi:MAG: hypothetical protein JW963_09350 [Anaerolineales bacterium]|nr:hypothetical protein [Anaerolineales bacterium]
MMDIAKAVFGGLMLFIGHDQEWLFALGLGLLVGLKLTFLLPAEAALWMILVVIAAGGAIGILPFLIYQDSSYVVSGFLFGGFFLSEYGSIVSRAVIGTGLAGSTWLIFFVGAVIGAAALGWAKIWGVMFATAMVGAFLVADLFTGLTPIAESLIAAGLFVVGCITQAIVMRIEKQTEK